MLSGRRLSGSTFYCRLRALPGLPAAASPLNSSRSVSATKEESSTEKVWLVLRLRRERKRKAESKKRVKDRQRQIPAGGQPHAPVNSTATPWASVPLGTHGSQKRALRRQCTAGQSSRSMCAVIQSGFARRAGRGS